MSDSCVTPDNKLAPNLNCCKGVKEDGSYTVFIYCVNTNDSSFTVPGKEGTFNFDCREGARTLVMSYLATILMVLFLTQ